ncbi:MAG: GNAT family N-acetyltransferase [Chloroflexota bacterium]|nr:GNAT family N-acetyltransferase [Chloroflexota bacterium]
MPIVRNAIKVGARVYLRPLEVADAPRFAEAGARETESGHDYRLPVSELAFVHWITAMSRTRPPREITFAVCEQETDRPLGGVTIRHLDWVNRTGETGSGLLAAADRGKGLGTEAKHLLLDYCFNDLGLQAVSASVSALNPRSAAALRKQGYRLAGRLTGDTFKNGAWQDALIFDLLREEWLAAREGPGGATKEP